jgi:hypothetical protein
MPAATCSFVPRAPLDGMVTPRPRAMPFFAALAVENAFSPAMRPPRLATSPTPRP